MHLWPRTSFGTCGTPWRRRYCSLAHTTRRTRPTGIAMRDESIEVGDPNRDIDAFLDQVYDSIDEQHVGAHLRMAPEEVVHDRGDIASAEQRRSADRELARWLAAAGDQCFLRLLQGGKDVTTALEILRALVRQVDSAGGAIEQRHAELTLERSQRADHGRQRRIELVRGRGQAARFHDAREGPHRQKLVHSGYSFIF